MPISCISCINDDGRILRCLISHIKPKDEGIYIHASLASWENTSTKINTDFVLYRKDDKRIRIVQDYEKRSNTYQPRKATYTEDRWFNPIRILFGRELSEGMLVYVDAVLVLPISHSIIEQVLNRLSENTLIDE